MIVEKYRCPLCRQVKFIELPKDARCYCVSNMQEGDVSYVVMEPASANPSGSVIVVAAQVGDKDPS